MDMDCNQQRHERNHRLRHRRQGYQNLPWAVGENQTHRLHRLLHRWLEFLCGGFAAGQARCFQEKNILGRKQKFSDKTLWKSVQTKNKVHLKIRRNDPQRNDDGGAQNQSNSKENYGIAGEINLTNPKKH